MESEKVKEIKESLDNCTNHYGTDCYHCPYLEKGCNIKLMEASLTLINELERENERLNKALVDNLDAYRDGFSEGAGLKKRVDDKLKTENQQLKDRIAELETEIKENAFYSKGYAQGIKNTYEIVVPDKLKQFAERLKEKVYDSFGDKVIWYNDIDETLKEVIYD